MARKAAQKRSKSPRVDDLVALHVLTGNGRRVIPAVVTKVGKGGELEVETWNANGKASPFGQPVKPHDPADWKPNTWAPMERSRARRLARAASGSEPAGASESDDAGDGDEGAEE